jgi:hypothetical protein
MAEETNSMWNDMLGIGGLVRAISDPAMLQNAALMMQAIVQSASTMQRIEQKLDVLLRETGHDPQQTGHAIAALLLEGNGAARDRGCAAASSVIDHGSGAAAAETIGPGRQTAVDPRHHRGR